MTKNTAFLRVRLALLESRLFLCDWPLSGLVAAGEWAKKKRLMPGLYQRTDGYWQIGNGYVEIISYDKLLKDAARRNRVLFEKLGLHKN